MNKNYKLLFLIILMLLILTLVLSTVNYKTMFSLVNKQIQQQSLPLALDNIYTDIQKQIIEPYLITSMMANDTFVKEWLLNDSNPNKIQKYLASIKTEYGLLSAILVDDKTKSYYTQDGFLETLHPKNRDNKWYFRFKNSHKSREINIDTNVKIDKSLIMFMNNKILDKNGTLIGITSTGVKIASIDNMLAMFRQKYHLEVYLFDQELNIILTQKDNQSIKNLKDIQEFKEHKKSLAAKSSAMFQYNSKNDIFIVNTKYIPELNIYILVKAKLSDFTQSIKQAYFFNLFISILTTLFVTLVILYIVKSSIYSLEKSNTQKDMLLQEVHHRVKNNLNIIASILGLQAIGKNSQAKEELNNSKARIESMALVHEMLYTQHDYEKISFNEYVKKLTQLLSPMYEKKSGLKVELPTKENLVLPLDIMIQLGLIINEMFTNSLKYATNPNGLSITIALTKNGDYFTFYYKDNGIKFLDIQSITHSSRLGIKLISLNVKQLDGKIETVYNKGLEYSIHFKSKKEV